MRTRSLGAAGLSTRAPQLSGRRHPKVALRLAEYLTRVAFLLSLAALAGTVLLDPGRVAAHADADAYVGFKWKSNSLGTSEVRDATTGTWASYSAEIAYGVEDWYWNTGIMPHIVSYPSLGDIYYFSASLGAMGPYGAVDEVWSDATLCFDREANPQLTGDCDYGTTAATFARIYLNNDNLRSGSSGKQYTATHELGHVYGLSHSATSGSHIMEIDGPPPYNVASADANHIAYRY